MKNEQEGVHQYKNKSVLLLEPQFPSINAKIIMVKIISLPAQLDHLEIFVGLSSYEDTLLKLKPILDLLSKKIFIKNHKSSSDYIPFTNINTNAI